MLSFQAMTVGTLSLSRRLREAKLTEQQSEAIAAAIGHAVDETVELRTGSDRSHRDFSLFASDLVHRRSACRRRVVPDDSEIEDVRARIATALRAARDINPMNDWLLARMVATQVITGCIILIAIKF